MLQVKITKLLHLCFLIPFLLATIFGLYLFLEGVVNDEIYKAFFLFVDVICISILAVNQKFQCFFVCCKRK